MLFTKPEDMCTPGVKLSNVLMSCWLGSDMSRWKATGTRSERVASDIRANEIQQVGHRRGLERRVSISSAHLFDCDSGLANLLKELRM